MISTLIALPYELARLPPRARRQRLADRLPETSGPRVTLDRAIGSADKVAGALLRNRDIARRGADRLERSDKLADGGPAREEAAARREQARETAAAGRRQAAQKRKAAQDRAASGLDEADAAEARGKQEAKAEGHEDGRREEGGRRQAGREPHGHGRAAQGDADAPPRQTSRPPSARRRPSSTTPARPSSPPPSRDDAEALGVVAAFGGFLRGLAGLVALGLRLDAGQPACLPLRRSRRSPCAARPSRAARGALVRGGLLRCGRLGGLGLGLLLAARLGGGGFLEARGGTVLRGLALLRGLPDDRSAAVSAACSRRRAAACSKRAAATSLSVRSMRSAPRWAMSRLRSTEPASLSAEPMARSSVTRGPEVSGSRSASLLSTRVRGRRAIS